ncbi:MAG: hypothetical protein ACR2NZ_07890 [Rubripirellula sp.]
MTLFTTLAVTLINFSFVEGVAADEAQRIAEAATTVRENFDRLDVDQNERLTVDEFVELGPSKETLRRDFLVYDFNRDRQLTRNEFSAVIGLTDDWLRGRIPDPFDQLLDDAVAALDESYDDWNERPKEFVNAHTFVANFIGSISPQGKRFVTGRILRQADRDSDGRLNRAEARSFMQYQLGIRWHDGAKLRERTGRVVRLDRFLAADRNRDNAVSLAEFKLSGWGRNSEEAFQLSDRDGSGRITYLEYSHYRATQNFFDPVAWFRLADGDLDAKLSRGEMSVLTEASKRHLLSSSVPAFDTDSDGLLNLQEFQLSMLGNVNYPWHRQPVDTNRDGLLSFDEFVFHELDFFQLQRRYYFHRLDRDQDGTLSVDEFEFRTEKPNAIYLRSDDGEAYKLVYQDERFPHLGRPSVSSSENRLLFERRRSINAKDCRIVLSDLSGAEPVELCSGSHPSWSYDGSKFVCERASDSGKQVWVMNADGRSGQPIARGTSPKWSPDGSRISFLHDNGVRIYDVASGDVQVLLERHQHSYRDLGTDVVWSPAGNQLAVLARRNDRCDLLRLGISRMDDERPGSSEERMKYLARGRSLSGFAGLMAWTSEGIIVRLPDEDLADSASDGERVDQDVAHSRIERSEVAGGRLYAFNPRLVNALPTPWRILDSSKPWKSACMVPGNAWYVGIADN